MATGIPASSLMSGGFAGRYDCPPAKADGTTPVSTYKSVDIYYRPADKTYRATIGEETLAESPSLVGCMQLVEARVTEEVVRIRKMAAAHPSVLATEPLWPTPDVAAISRVRDEISEAAGSLAPVSVAQLLQWSSELGRSLPVGGAQ